MIKSADYIKRKFTQAKGGFQPGKNHKYFKKRKLDIEFEFFPL